MDRDTYSQQINGRNALWLRHGFKGRLGITKATATWGSADYPTPWIYQYLDDVVMDCVENGTLAKVFTGETPRKLIPVIYLHGLTCSRTSQSVSCRDLASHGFIVFSIDHFDGTCNFARLKSGEEKYWSSLHDPYDR